MELTFALHVPHIALLDTPRAMRILQQELGRAGQQVMEAIAAAARLRAPVDRGILRSSIEVTPSRYGHQGNLVDMAVRTGRQAPYAGDIERGTKPHWIAGEDFVQLQGWARRKLGNARLAYAVRHTIAQKGTAAQPFLEPAAREGAPQAPIRLQAAMALAAHRLVQ